MGASYLSPVVEFLALRVNMASDLQQKRTICPECQGSGEVIVQYHPAAGYGEATISCAFCQGIGTVSDKRAQWYHLGDRLQSIATFVVVPLAFLVGFILITVTQGSMVILCYSGLIGTGLAFLGAWLGKLLKDRKHE